ncbi:glycosyltransferase family 1 protein [Hypoxylon fuscum]|nr:glycosyltransferase family 1 protein [Hypoxylon fuscum]
MPNANTDPDAATDSAPTATGKEPRRPSVLILSHALTGHLAPLLRIAASLQARGWRTYFLGPTAHQHRIEAAGSVFLPLRADADLDDRAYYESPPAGAAYASLPWPQRVLEDLRAQVLQPLPTQWSCVRDALSTLHAAAPDPSPGVVVLAEAFFFGVLPLFYGAALPPGVPPPLGSVCVSVTVPAIRSADLPPAGYAFAPDASAAGRARNAALWERSWARKAAALTALLDERMREAGARRGVGEVFLSGANYTAHETILQLGVPGLEYPRSDWPAGFKFAGLVQGGASSTSTTPATAPLFPWWSEILANAALPPSHPAKRKILVVAQGTVETNPEDLILPTLRAFASRSDVLVVAILGWKDACLSAPDIPANARVADYLSYDAALAHADAWIHNGGFGAVGHGVAHGVPMVVAGEGMDKADNARRVAWAGVGVDLGTATPTSAQVREGVEQVLQDEQYARRVRELRRESEELDCFGLVHGELLRIAETRPGVRQRGLETQ